MKGLSDLHVTEDSGAYDSLVSIIKSNLSSLCSHKSLAPRSISIKNYRSPPIWWSKDCQAQIDEREEAMSLFKNHPSMENFFNYKKVSASVAKSLKKLKRQSWKKLCSTFDNKTPTSKLWKMVKMFRNRNLNDNNDGFSSGISLAELNKAISKLCPDSCRYDNRASLGNMEAQDAVNPGLISELDLAITLEELNIAIDSSKPEPSPGLDQIDYGMIKSLPLNFRSKLLEITTLYSTRAGSQRTGTSLW